MYDQLLIFMRQHAWAFAVPLGIACGLAHKLCTERGLKICEAEKTRLPLAETIAVAALTAFLTWLLIVYRVQITDKDVVPTTRGEVFMLVYHLILTVLLLSAASVDFRTCFIPDFIPLWGAVIGVLGAGAIGEVQIMHLWVDWTQEIPQRSPAAVPDWIAAHWHLHGLAWSLTGLAAGAGLTWLLRALSGLVLGQEALGMGDVFLMGMAGAFIGWQPIVIALAIAPIAALVVGGIAWLVGGKQYMPYGPFLAIGVLVTLFAWKYIWLFEFDFGEPHSPAEKADFALRRMFGDPVGLLMLAGIVLIALTVLLGALRWVKSVPLERLPGKRHRSSDPT
jgi:leader peptidase (prepilin peptidase)/N-methyltransferase